MKPSVVIAFFAAQTLLSTAQPAEPRTPQRRSVPVATRAPQAWLGLKLAKPDETIASHVPSLPPGMGFIVKSVDPGGPAEAAGLTQFDLVWKLGDQMLVNEAQLGALLRLSKPGEEVAISAFRGGKPLEVKLKFGEAPPLQKPIPGEMLEAALLPGSREFPMRVVNVASKSASFSDNEGKAVVRREGETYAVKISGPKDETIFDGELAKDRQFDNVPEPWRAKIHVLCRTLDQALGGGMVSSRQARPRVVPEAPV